MLMSVQGRKSRYVTKLSSWLKFMCSRSPAPATVGVFTRQRKRGGRAWCHGSLGRLSWLSVTGLLFVLILGPGTLHTMCNVQCQDRRRDNCPCPLFSVFSCARARENALVAQLAHSYAESSPQSRQLSGIRDHFNQEEIPPTSFICI